MNETSTEWRQVRVKEIADEIVGGGTPAREVPSLWGGGIPWVTPSELTKLPTKYLTATADTISRAGLANSGARLLPANALIVTTRATIGLAALTLVPTATNQGFKSIIFSGEADPSYYYHLFKTLKREMVRRASGTTFLEISGKEFSQIVVPLPPLAEQREIAKMLDTLDEQILVVERTVVKLGLSKQGFLDNVFAQSNDSNLDSLRAGWITRSLEDLTIAPICYGIVQAGSYSPSGVLVLTIGDLHGDFVMGLHRTARAIDEQYTRSRVSPGDVLVSIKGTIGRLAVVPEGFVGNISRDMARLRFSSEVLPEFARQYLGSTAGQRRLGLAVVGTTRAEISIHTLKRFVMPVPPITSQSRIVDICVAYDRAIATEIARLAKLRLVRDGLMSDLLTGRVRAPAGAVA